MKETCPQCGFRYETRYFDSEACVICGFNPTELAAKGGSSKRLLALSGLREQWDFLATFSVVASIIEVLIVLGIMFFPRRQYTLEMGLLALFWPMVITATLTLRMLRALCVSGWVCLGFVVCLFAPLVSAGLVLHLIRRCRKALIEAGLPDKPGEHGGFSVIARNMREHCHQCGYDLRGNRSGRCPECGALLPAPRPRDETTSDLGS